MTVLTCAGPMKPSTLTPFSPPLSRIAVMAAGVST